MKKIYILCILLLITGFLFSDEIITIDLPEINDAVPGTQVAIPIIIYDINATIAAMEIWLEYDTTVLTPVLFQNIHPNFQASPWTSWPDYYDSEWGLGWMDETFYGQPIEPGDTLIELVFEYAGGYSLLRYGQEVNSGGSGGLCIFLPGMSISYCPFTAFFMDGYVSDCILQNYWTGEVSEDWFDENNWSGGSYPSYGYNVHVSAGKLFDPVINTFEAECYDLVIEAGVTFTISESGGLFASGTVKCNGDFVMLSDTLGNSAGFRDGGIDPESAGTFIFDRVIEAYDPEDDHLGWHFISSPVSGFNNWNMYNYYVNYWNEGASGVNPDFPWVHMEGDPAIPCTPGEQLFIGTMEGWSVRQDLKYGCDAILPGTDNHILFTGNFTDVYTGDFNRNYTMDGEHAYAGYNLIGNPYPSWVDMTAFAGLSVHIWDSSADDYLDWAGSGDFYKIPPTQGFFVFGGGAGNITLTNTNRASSEQPFEKCDQIEIVLLATGNSKEDKTYIRFSEKATSGYDNTGVDAYKLFGTGIAPQIYTELFGEQFSINTLQPTDMIPLKFFVTQSGEYTIEAIKTGDLSFIVLEDIETNKLTDLLIDPYTFNFTSGTKDFLLHLSDKPEFKISKIKIWSYEQNIYVKVSGTTSASVIVSNTMGQVLIKTEIEAGLNIIPVNNINSYYVVKVLSSYVSKTEKVLIK